MSRLWDTPEFWARSEADEALREMPDVEPAALAASFEKSAASYDGDPEMVAVADLRRRAAAGVRFWPRPQTWSRIPHNLSAVQHNGENHTAKLIDDEVPC